LRVINFLRFRFYWHGLFFSFIHCSDILSEVIGLFHILFDLSVNFLKLDNSWLHCDEVFRNFDLLLHSQFLVLFNRRVIELLQTPFEKLDF